MDFIQGFLGSDCRNLILLDRNFSFICIEKESKGVCKATIDYLSTFESVGAPARPKIFSAFRGHGILDVFLHNARTDRKPHCTTHFYIHQGTSCYYISYAYLAFLWKKRSRVCEGVGVRGFVATGDKAITNDYAG